MKDLPIYKIHLKEELIIDELNLKLKLLVFKEAYYGKEYEELGDRTDLKFSVKIGNDKKQEFEFAWMLVIPDEYRHFRFLDFELFVLNTSFEPLRREDEKGRWLKFIIYKYQENIDYDKLLRQHLLLDKDNLF